MQALQGSVEGRAPMPVGTSAEHLSDRTHVRSRAEIPPPGYWRRWTADLAGPDARPSPAPTPEPSDTAMPSQTPTPPRHGRSASAPRTAEELQGQPYRVLIVEDDRAQALFAQSILHGAGMQAEVQTDPDT